MACFILTRFVNIHSRKLDDNDFYFEPKERNLDLVQQCAHHMVPPYGTIRGRDGGQRQLPMHITDVASLIQIKNPKTGSSTLNGIFRLLSLGRPELETFTPPREVVLAESFVLEAAQVVPWCEGVLDRVTGRLSPHNVSLYDGRKERQYYLQELENIFPRHLQRQGNPDNISTCSP